MDGNAQTAWRNWLIGAAAAGFLCPGLTLGQTARPVTRTAPPPVKPAVRVRPTADPISQAAYQPATGNVQVADSEIQQRLRELYERDGREMPEMQLSPMQTPQAATPAATQPAPAMQPRYSAAPRVAQTASRPSENRVSSFFKKLVPGGNKRAQTPAPAAQPRQLPTPNYQQPVIQPAPTNQPATAARPIAIQPQLQPQQQQPTPQLRQAQTQPAAILAPPPALIPPSPTASIQETEAFELPTSPQAADESETLDLPELNEESLGAPTFDSENELDDDLDEEMTEEMDAAPVLPPSPSQAEDFPDPFGESSDAAEEAAPQVPEETPAPEPSPYTGKTLEVEEPATVPADEFLPPLERAGADDEVTEETTASKMRRIIQRSDMKGLKGFCPVTLRDQRELADSRPEFSASHRGQKFFFASKVAQARFEQDPARYAPAAFGADVVVLTDEQDVVEGTLDFAAWYKGRLYLFGTQGTHDKFVSQPDKYASPPGIE